MGDNQLIQVHTKTEGVKELVIGPAPSNIVSEAVMDEIMAHLEQSVKDNNTKMVILTGEGEHFSFGASVPEHTPEKVGSMLPKFHILIDKILSCPVPVMARVRGNCLGGGFEVVMACHFIFADKSASFAVPEIKLGVFPPPASALLPLMIGESVACEITMTGVSKSGDELKSYGLVNEIFDNVESLEEGINKFINKRISPLSASSLRYAAKAVRTGIVERYRDNIKTIEKLYLQELMKSHDAVEGITSFMEKRKPVWNNQ